MKKTFLACLLLCLTSSLQASETLLSEASAVTKLGSYLYIAGDDTPSGLWKVNETTLQTQLLPWSDAELKMEDMEGLALLEDSKLLLTSSMSRNKSGKVKKNRNQVAVLSPTENSITVEFVLDARETLLSFVEKTFGPSLDTEWFNIEGIAFQRVAENSAVVYFGLRAPALVSGETSKPLILIADASFLNTHTQPTVTGILEIDIAAPGQGVRDLTVHDNRLYALLGPINDAAVALFTLVKYDGTSWQNVASKYEGFSALTRPEGITFDAAGALWVAQDFESGESAQALVTLKFIP